MYTLKGALAVSRKLPMHKSAAAAAAGICSVIAISNVCEQFSNKNEGGDDARAVPCEEWHFRRPIMKSTEDRIDVGSCVNSRNGWRKYEPSMAGMSLSGNNFTSCDFMHPTAGGSAAPDSKSQTSARVQIPSRLNRRRTIQRMNENATKATVRSKYDIQFHNPLGEGGFGAVYIGTNRKTQEKVAIKQIDKKLTDSISFQREMNAFLHIKQRGISHPNICGLHENFEEDNSYYLVLDLVQGGEMFDHLCKNGAYSEADAARLVREVTSALSFLHGIGCVHGDMKPENLMLSTQNPSDAVIKVVDFGCAQIIDPTSPFFDGNSVVALTAGYSPPEVVKNVATTSAAPSMDMFSLGVIIYIMLTGVHPFDIDGTASEEEINRNVLSPDGPPLRNSEYTEHLSDSAIELIENLLRHDPQKRLTAYDMLQHPWVNGETARTGIIADSDTRLKKYRAYKSKLEAKVFASMVQWSEESGNSMQDDTSANRASLMERSFKMLDPEQRGYISTKALKELSDNSSSSKDDQDRASGAASNDDDDQLSLSSFETLLSDSMKSKYFPAGHTVWREGDIGNNMYFINSGRIEVTTQAGFRAIGEQGSFFGEGALLHDSSTRSASVRCLTPVHAIEISREYFEKYMADGYDVKLQIREKDKTRRHDQAKEIVRMHQNMKQETCKRGDYLYKVGEEGSKLYILEDGKVDVIVEDHTVFSLKPGEVCGEYSLLFGRPRNTSARCLSEECRYHVLPAEEFHKILKTHNSVRESMLDKARIREFQKALVFKTKKPFPTNEQDMIEAFDLLDENRSGLLDLSDIEIMLKRMDPTFTGNDIKDILNSLDLDQSGAISYAEFKRIFGR